MFSGVVSIVPVTIDGKGRLIIPVEMRRQDNIQSGDTLVATQTIEGKIILEKAT